MVTFRGWYTNSFVASDGETPVEGGDGRSGFYYEKTCTLDDAGFPVIPELDIQPTTGSNPTAGFFGALFVNEAFTRMIFGGPSATAGWQIPISPTTTTFGALALYNATVQLLIPPVTYATYQQMLLALQLFEENFPDAAVGIKGVTQLSWTPDVDSEPIALGENDPRVGDLRGTLTPGVIPKATGTKTQADSQIADDGIDVSVQTLNYFQAGDYQDLQNGSYLNVNDGLGRANLFAGGGPAEEPASQYAGVAAVADETSGTIYLQSTDYNHLIGSSDGITKLGDAQEEHNGTRLEIDDVNEWIKLHNLPSSDPGELNALWKDGSNNIKISAG